MAVKRKFIDPGSIIIPDDYIREVGADPIKGEDKIHAAILVTPKLVLVDGLRRLLKALEDKLKKVAVDIDDELKIEKDIIRRQMILDLQRKELGPIERAKGFQKFIRLHKVSGREAARMLGVSKTMVEFHLKLLDLSKDLQQKISSGAVKPYSLERMLYKNRIGKGSKFNSMNQAQQYRSLLNRLTSFKKYLLQCGLDDKQLLELKRIVSMINESLDTRITIRAGRK